MPETSLELSILMPCLNEAETLEICIQKAKAFLRESGIAGEVLVADNGSTDGSQDIARAAGARVVPVAAKGYGSALRGGIEAALGTYVIMGDADDSYDFSNLTPFVEKLRSGYDVVIGNRFQGGIAPGAMPWLHRFLGNPVLTALGRVFFRSPAGDFHCGLRGIRRERYAALGLRTTGMEFASEMIIKSSLHGFRIAEVPTTLRPDGRSRPPHLRTWHDGWRHLRFMLLYSPRWLFLMPGLLIFGIGLVGGIALLLGRVVIGSVVFDVHSLFVAGLACMLGYQLMIFAVFTKSFAIVEGFYPSPRYFDWIFRYVNLETGILAGLAMSLAGLALVIAAVLGWQSAEFGGLDPRVTMRQLVPGAVLLTLGVQTVYSSFFLSILGLRRD